MQGYHESREVSKSAKNSFNMDEQDAQDDVRNAFFDVQFSRRDMAVFS
jgi:hypothetical protein